MEKKYTLPKEFAQKWIEALRSGKYEQNFGRYSKPNSNYYCALGVGLIANAIIITGHGFNAQDDLDEVFYNASKINSLNDAIVDINDRRKLSFPEIADWIAEC